MNIKLKNKVEIRERKKLCRMYGRKKYVDECQTGTNKELYDLRFYIQDRVEFLYISPYLTFVFNQKICVKIFT